MTMFSEMLNGAARIRGTVLKEKGDCEKEMLMEHTPKSKLQAMLYYYEMPERMASNGALKLSEHDLSQAQEIRTELEAS